MADTTTLPETIDPQSSTPQGADEKVAMPLSSLLGMGIIALMLVGMLLLQAQAKNLF
jgi:hypothetical protein